MTPELDAAAKTALHRQLVAGRDALVWKLEGVEEYDARRPLTSTGTNLLGLVKHISGVAAAYFGGVFDRPFPGAPAWMADDAPRNSDMYATADESREEVLAMWRAAWEHADRTVEDLPLLAPGVVPWWSPDRRHVTLLDVLAHVGSELHRHAGHADIVRELLDGSAGLRAGHDNLPEADEQWWVRYVDQVREAAAAYR